MPSWLTQTLTFIRDLPGRASPKWPWPLRKVRKADIHKEERDLFERSGETVTSMQVAGSFTGNVDHAKAWLTERADYHERREQWISGRDLFLDIVIILLIGWEIRMSYRAERLQNDNFREEKAVFENLQSSSAATADATKQNANLTRKNAHFDQRAWLAFSFGKYTYTSGQPLLTVYKVTDTGRTPARNVNGVVVTHFMKSGEKPTFTYDHWTSADLGTMLPGIPQNAASYLLPSGAPKGAHVDPLKLSRDMALQLKSGTGYIIVYGKIDYDSVFGAHHWVTFCQGSGPSEFTHPQECVDYNQVDDNEEP